MRFTCNCYTSISFRKNLRFPLKEHNNTTKEWELVTVQLFGKYPDKINNCDIYVILTQNGPHASQLKLECKQEENSFSVT